VAIGTGMAGIFSVYSGSPLVFYVLIGAMAHAVWNAVITRHLFQARSGDTQRVDDAAAFAYLLQSVERQDWVGALQTIDVSETLGLNERAALSAGRAERWNAELADGAGVRVFRDEVSRRGITQEKLNSLLHSLEVLRGKEIVLYLENESTADVARIVAPLLAKNLTVRVVLDRVAPTELKMQFAGRAVEFVDARRSRLLVRGKTRTVDTAALKADFGWDLNNLIFAAPAGVTVVSTDVPPVVVDLEQLLPLVQLLSNDALFRALRAVSIAA